MRTIPAEPPQHAREMVQDGSKFRSRSMFSIESRAHGKVQQNGKNHPNSK